MNLLKQANACCLRLAKDESGVALALTVVVFLTLFVMACSVYAVGETMRQRIEAQNAADTAAYAAAVVQADALSRLAAINRAMGWTYAQQVKMEMDYIVDKWLVLTVVHWLKDYIKSRVLAGISTCSLGPHTGKDDYYAGQNYNQREHVRLNRHRWVSVKDVIKAHKNAAGQGKSFGKLSLKILKATMNIKGMNKAEVGIIKSLPKKIHGAAQRSLRENIADTDNDRMAKRRGADLRFAVITEPQKCFKVQKSEHAFLRSVFGRGTSAKALFGEGTDSWFVLAADGVQRKYQQLGNKLVSEWWWHGATWLTIPTPPYCVRTISKSGHSEVKAEEGYKAPFYETALCEPQIVTPEYFEKPGAIVVAVARRAHNPFQFMFRRKDPDGLYGLYSLPNRQESGRRYLWAAAAARAGYRDLGRPDGTYNPTVDSWEVERDLMVPRGELPDWWRRNSGWQGLSPHNLTQSDWDAVFLPLHRAWSARVPAWQNRGPASGAGAQASAGRWRQKTGGRILQELWTKAKWEELRGRDDGDGGLRRWADGRGPEGMTGDISYSAMEDLVYH